MPAPGLARLNTAADSDVVAELHEVCASSAWGRRVLAGRPYADAEAICGASDAAMAELTADDLAEAMAGHPPIGRPKPGDPTSAREQRGMAGASEELRAEMLELNLDYQEKFGHVFLICATGRTGEQMRDAVRERIGHSPEQEREIVRAELGKINRIRLARLVSPPEEETRMSTGTSAAATPHTSVSTHILDTSIGRPAQGVAVSLSARAGSGAAWAALGKSATDADGRCKDLPALPEGTTHVRLDFGTEDYFLGQGQVRAQRPGPAGAAVDPQADAQQDAPANRDSGAFFPEVAITFAVDPGEHYHVPLLLNPFGYSVYRGS
ncbi:2-oxo-4-hydroxy-4-carboxy-5-ureidoimidazoline decarboxylase [Streptomyces sp. SCSIO 30461]